MLILFEYDIHNNNQCRTFIIISLFLIILLVNTCIICAYLIIFFVIYKKEHHMQIGMTFANCVTLMHQINIAQVIIPNQYSFMNGSIFAALQTGLCFTIDFKYSFPSIVLHFIFRFSVLSYYVNSFDYMLFLLGLLTLCFLSSVLYICNRAQRLQFLMNLKDDTIMKQLETLINSPFSKIKYDKDNLKIDVQMAKSIDQFIGHSEDFCIGCNIRHFMRNCRFTEQSNYYSNLQTYCLKNQKRSLPSRNNKTLESSIANGVMPLNQSLAVNYNKQQLIIRICDYNIDSSLIIIQEKQLNQRNNENFIPLNVKKQLNLTFTNCKSSKENQIYRYGVLSILQLNHMVIKNVNVSKMIHKINKLYDIQSQIVMKRNNLSDISLSIAFSFFLHLIIILIIYI